MNFLKSDEGAAARLDAEEGLGKSIEQLAERIEIIADSLEGP